LANYDQTLEAALRLVDPDSATGQPDDFWIRRGAHFDLALGFYPEGAIRDVIADARRTFQVFPEHSDDELVHYFRARSRVLSRQEGDAFRVPAEAVRAWNGMRVTVKARADGLSGTMTLNGVMHLTGEDLFELRDRPTSAALPLAVSSVCDIEPGPPPANLF
jgi:hypothetical protein